MSAACSRASSHTSLLTLTMPPTLLQSQSTDATTLENYDIESELPESNECEEGEEAEPELYCFEDFISYDLQPQRPPLERTVSVNPEVYHSLTRRSNRELQRSKTLPIIRLSSDNGEDTVLDAGSRCNDDIRWMSQSPVSSEYSGSCGSEDAGSRRRRSLSKLQKQGRDKRREGNNKGNNSKNGMEYVFCNQILTGSLLGIQLKCQKEEGLLLPHREAQIGLAFHSVRF
uniref:Uncharacterized protein n=1 Tax=Magallana gigas TaxID=29159 RepID=A0A8W8JC51_MAGGI